jgi:hypothetical protein
MTAKEVLVVMVAEITMLRKGFIVTKPQVLVDG